MSFPRIPSRRSPPPSCLWRYRYNGIDASDKRKEKFCALRIRAATRRPHARFGAISTHVESLQPFEWVIAPARCGQVDDWRDRLSKRGSACDGTESEPGYCHALRAGSQVRASGAIADAAEGSAIGVDSHTQSRVANQKIATC